MFVVSCLSSTEASKIFTDSWMVSVSTRPRLKRMAVWAKNCLRPRDLSFMICDAWLTAKFF